jgi:hypothetical protein
MQALLDAQQQLALESAAAREEEARAYQARIDGLKDSEAALQSALDEGKKHSRLHDSGAEVACLSPSSILEQLETETRRANKAEARAMKAEGRLAKEKWEV